jgi:uncharacterized OB-fold protein
VTTTAPTEGSARLPAKPVPVPDEASRPFFEGAYEGRLMLLHCASCGTWMSPTGGIGTPVRPRCVECFSGDLEWSAASGRATLYSFAVVHQLYDPAFADDVPYNIAVVETAEGVRLTSQVVGTSCDELVIGMALEAVFERVGEGVGIPRFQACP